MPPQAAIRNALAGCSSFGGTAGRSGRPRERCLAALLRSCVVPAVPVRCEPLEPELLEHSHLARRVVARLVAWRQRVEDLERERSLPEGIPVPLQLPIAVTTHPELRPMPIQGGRQIGARPDQRAVTVLVPHAVDPGGWYGLLV